MCTYFKDLFGESNFNIFIPISQDPVGVFQNRFFQYNEPYKQRNYFLPYKGGSEIFTELVVGLKISETKNFFVSQK